ncbi:MAG: methyltransferase family protein [Methanosarcinales archaeon]
MDLRARFTQIKIIIPTALLFIFMILLLMTVFSTLTILLGIYGVIDLDMNIMDHFTSESYAYFNWIAVLISIALFSFFVISFLTPMKKREWRSLGMYHAFIIALFTEMYGFPLTIYFISQFFGVQLSYGHMQGHLLGTMIASTGIISMEVAWSLVMIISNFLMLIGFIFIYRGWQEIHRSKSGLVTFGIYKYVRHPQYFGLILITIGMLVQWPTIITIAMWPILMIMYYRLAKKEEKELEELFGDDYLLYKKKVPMFIPLIRY